MNNLDLVVYAKKALSEKWGYVWGTFGQLLTNELLQQKIAQYPSGVGDYESFIKNNWLNKKVSDCVGLIKGAYWSESGNLKYDSNTDVSADTMFNLAKIKGNMSDMPDMPGLCLWKAGHIGIYIGNGLVIEANSTLKGVIQTPLLGTGRTPWTNWLECPYIEYIKRETEPTIEYQSQVQLLGWQEWKADGEVSGTEGKSLRLEALAINVDKGNIEFSGHIQNVGWQENRHNGEIIGTVGRGLRLEAVKIKLIDLPGYSVQYQSHVEGIGWMDWCYDGEVSGTVGRELRIESIKIKIVKK
jgi:hypothetical protein